MSKVYSFRLSDDNPREAQAREVIEAWVGEGYSLRYILIEALLSMGIERNCTTDIEQIILQLEELIQSSYKKEVEENGVQRDDSTLPDGFTVALRNSIRTGIKLSDS